MSLLLLLAAMGCQDNPAGLPDMRVAVVEVSPNARTLTVGDTMLVSAYPKTATGVVLGGIEIEWTSQNGDVVQLTERGGNVLVRAQAPGTVEIYAAAEGRQGKVTVTVVAAQLPVASVEIANGADSVVVGQSVRFDAIARAADGTVLGGRAVAWQVSDPTIATIAGPPDGGHVVLTAHRTAAVHLTASVEGWQAQRTVRVVPLVQTPVHSISFDPPEGVISLHTAQTHQLRVRAFAIDGSELTGRVTTWRSADSTIASVDDNGVVTARRVGNTDVVATVEGRTAFVAIDVRSLITGIDMNPGTGTLAVGDEITVQATLRAADGAVLQRPITWTSTNDAVATVDANGRVVARAAGSATILATAEGQQGWTHLTVVPWGERPLLAIGDSTPPTTLFTRVTHDASGVERVTRVVATSGVLRLAVTGSGMNIGKYQMVFDVAITTDGQAPQYGQYVYAGTFGYSGTMLTFSSYSGQSFTSVPHEGGFRMTGKLEPDLPAVTLSYGIPLSGVRE